MSVPHPKSHQYQPVELAVLVSPHRKINLLLCIQTFMAHCTRKRSANQLGKCDIFVGLFVVSVCCGPFAFSAYNRIIMIAIDYRRDNDGAAHHDDHNEDEVAFKDDSAPKTVVDKANIF